MIVENIIADYRGNEFEFVSTIRFRMQRFIPVSFMHVSNKLSVAFLKRSRF